MLRFLLRAPFQTIPALRSAENLVAFTGAFDKKKMDEI